MFNTDPSQKFLAQVEDRQTMETPRGPLVMHSQFRRHLDGDLTPASWFSSDLTPQLWLLFLYPPWDVDDPQGSILNPFLLFYILFPITLLQSCDWKHLYYMDVPQVLSLTCSKLNLWVLILGKMAKHTPSTLSFSLNAALKPGWDIWRLWKAAG